MSIVKDFILSEFSKLGNIIKSEEYLEKYVDHCISKNLIKITTGHFARHHILPKAKTLPFQKYENFQDHPWNQSVLSHYDHYYAHFLLTQAIDHIAVYFSFCKMHNADLKNERITESELIDENIYNEIQQSRIQKWREYLLEQLEIDGVVKTRASHINSNRKLSDETKKKASNRMKGNKNIVYLDGVVEKIRKTKVDNKIDQISAKKAASKMKEKFINADGNLTTIYKEAAKKQSKIWNSLVMDENGNKITKAEKRGKTRSRNDILRGKWFEIRNVFDDSISLILPEIMVRKISPGLMFKTEDDYLGKSKFGQTFFNKSDRTYLIGLYAEELPSIPHEYNLDQDYTPYL
jgi:hypothetical protein